MQTQEAYWNQRFAGDWEACNGREQTRSFMESLLHDLPDDIYAYLATASIVDIGCALGDGCAVLQEHFPESRITGVDISSVGIERAKALYPKLNFEKAPCSFIPDVSICSNVLEHLPEWELAFRAHLVRTGFIYIALVPYKQAIIEGEHVNRFNDDSFPEKVGEWILIYQNHERYPAWGNDEQLLVVYQRT